MFYMEVRQKLVEIVRNHNENEVKKSYWFSVNIFVEDFMR